MKAIGRVAAHLGSTPEREAGMQLSLIELRPENSIRPRRGSLPRGSQTLEPRPLTTDAPPSPARVLVVDDDDSMRKIAEDAMTEAGYEVLSARNGVEALSVALSEPVDLILTDVTMPSMDGWQLLRLVRARPKLASTPVIFVTRLTSDVERLKGYELGVSDYVDKPYDNAMLQTRVENQLKKQKGEASSPGAKVLRGDLGQVALASLLSLLEMERRSGVLTLKRENEQATLYLQQGLVIRIDVADAFQHKQGLQRFFHVLEWTAGNFALRATPVLEKPELDTPTTHALLAHAKRVDDAARP